MAWQGFEVFRRRQKTILAVLAVLAMVLFIIGDVLIGVGGGTSGLGYGLRQWFMDTRLEQLLILHDQRRAALETLQRAWVQAHQNWLRSRFNVTSPTEIKDENLRKQYEQETDQVERTLCGQLLRGGFLGMTLDFNAEGLLEFAYWKEEADRLGIVIASSVMQQEFERFTFGQISERELQQLVHKSVRYLASTEDLYRWWADEIRAALARRIAGAAPGHRAYSPPLLELWEAYRELSTSLPQVTIVSLEVLEERFTRAVPEPSDQELRDYFNQHKQREPDPMRPEPGFRVPPRYRVNFVYADVRYDSKDPAKTGEAWPHYRQLTEVVFGLPPLLSLNPTLLLGGPASLTHTLPGMSLSLRAYDLYLSERAKRFRIEQTLAAYGLTNTPLDQLIHHHGILPPGTGPWYQPGVAEVEQAIQAVLRGITTLSSALALANPALALVGPMSVKAPRVESLAADVAATLGQCVGLTLSLTAPIVVGAEPPANWSAAQIEALSAASFVGQLANPGVPLWSQEILRQELRPPRTIAPVHLVPGYEGLALTWWTPPSYVPFVQVAPELEIEFLRGQVARFLDADLQQLQKDLKDYGQLYQKAYSEWRRKGNKPEVHQFVPPPFGPHKQPLEEYIQKFCQARGLRYFPMSRPRSRYDLMPRASGELGKILYPLYLEVTRPEGTAQHPLEIYRRELDFADMLITGKGLLTDFSGDTKQPERIEEKYAVYEPRHLARAGLSGHRALIWKAEELPGYVPSFEEARPEVRQAWIREKARHLAQEHARRLANRIRELRQQRQTPLDDVLRELRGDPNFQELEKAVTVELTRYRYELLSRPLTGLERSPPGPVFRAVQYPPVVDYPESDFLVRAFEHLKIPGDFWITTNQPGDKVYLLVLVSEPRSRTPTEFSLDYLRRPHASRIRVSDTPGPELSLPLEQWVSARRSRSNRDQFLKYLRHRYGLDDEEWRQLEDYVRQRF
ncbi:MAG: hypothetical protein RMI91_08540 [Gemmatales bacterium]|nr:hypothetical protein [Gemmatales bacterium]MDW7994688.1 hypothetical protein [Gemmatales bacterium]